MTAHLTTAAEPCQECGHVTPMQIENGWLVEIHDHCTCGGSGILSPAHLPGCGSEPVCDMRRHPNFRPDTPTVDHDGLAEVLAEVAVAHQRHRSDACLCGPLRLGSSWAEHLAAHQADAVLAWIGGQR